MRHPLIVACAFVLALGLACALPGPAPIEPPALQQVSADELSRVRQTILSSARAGDLAPIEALVDLDALMRLALAGLAVDSAVMEGARRGAGRQVVTQMFGGVADSGAIRHMGDRPGDDGTWMRFALVYGDGTFNHTEVLVSERDGRPRVVDFFGLTGGERISSVVRRMITLGLGDDMSLGDEEAARVEHMTRLNEAVAAGDGERISEAFDALPAEFRTERAFHLLRIAGTMTLPDERRYHQALQEFVEAFPDDPAARVHAIDLAHLSGDPAAAAEHAEALNAAEGPDAYLLVLAAAAWLEAGQPDRARAALDRAEAAEPELVFVHEQRVDVALAHEDHAATAAALTRLERDHGYDFGPALDPAIFGSFVDSPEHREWLASR